MTRPTHCHAGQQQQPGLAQRGRLPETDGVKFLPKVRSGRPGLHLASIHQVAPPKRGCTHLIIALLLIYRPRKDERLSWPSWLTCSGRFSYMSDHPSAAGQAQDGKDRRRNTDVLPLGYTTNQSFPRRYRKKVVIFIETLCITEG